MFPVRKTIVAGIVSVLVVLGFLVTMSINKETTEIVNNSNRLTKSIPLSLTKQEYRLCIATTMGYAKTDEKRQFYYNTISSFHKLGESVLPVVFTTDEDIIEYCNSQNIYSIQDFNVNQFGLPLFKGIVEKLGSIRSGVYPIECSFYGYVNGDILLDSRMETLLQNIQLSQKEYLIHPKVLLVGRRTNSFISPTVKVNQMSPYDYLQFIKREYKKNEQFMGLAMDYFIFTYDVFGNDFLSDVVVGRDMIDSYIYHYAYSKEDVSVIDCSNALIAIHQTGKEGNWGNKKTITSEEDDLWNTKLVTSLYGNQLLAKTTFLSPNRLSRSLSGKLQLLSSKAMDDEFSLKALQFLDKYLSHRDCLLYGNGRVEGSLTSICKTIIAQFFDTNFIGHRTVKWIAKTKQNLDPIKKKEDRAENSCLIYKDYILHPLKQNNSLKKLKNEAVILNGSCSHDIMLILTKYASSTANIILIGSELEKNENIINDQVLQSYYSKVKSLSIDDDFFAGGIQIYRRNQQDIQGDEYIKKELKLFGIEE